MSNKKQMDWMRLGRAVGLGALAVILFALGGFPVSGAIAGTVVVGLWA